MRWMEERGKDERQQNDHCSQHTKHCNGINFPMLTFCAVSLIGLSSNEILEVEKKAAGAALLLLGMRAARLETAKVD